MAFNNINSAEHFFFSAKATASGEGGTAHVTKITLLYQATKTDTGKSPLTVTQWVDIWHLFPPTLANNWNYTLGLTREIVFDLNNSILSSQGWVLTNECHLQQSNCDSCRAHSCHERLHAFMREGLVRSQTSPGGFHTTQNHPGSKQRKKAADSKEGMTFQRSV